MKTPEYTKAQDYTTLQLMYKTFKEVISTDVIGGIAYPFFKLCRILLDIYTIFIMGNFLDSIVDYLSNNSTFTIKDFVKSDVLSILLTLLAIFLLYRGVKSAKKFYRNRLQDLFWYKFNKGFIKKMSDLNLEDIEKPRLQNLITSVQSYSFKSIWNTYLFTTRGLGSLVNLISAGIIIVNNMAWWGLVVILFVLPEALVRYHFNKKEREYRDRHMEKEKYFNYLQRQSILINNFPELRVDNIFDFFQQSYRRAAKPYYEDLNNQIRKKRDIWHFVLSWFDGALRTFMQILLIPIAVVQNFSIGKFKYLFDYIHNLYHASWKVIWNFLKVKYQVLYVEDYFNFKEYKGFGNIAAGTNSLDPIKIPKIEFVNVSFKYVDSTSAALNNISMTVNPGEKVAVIGHDNSGKSTIAKLLSGLYQIGPGDILIDDISITNLKRGELKDKIAVVFENYIKYKFSIRKNITVSEPNRDFNRRKYEEALEITGLHKWMEEEQLDDSQILGKLFSNGKEISSGHWQRVAIARALYRDRSILVLDESFTQIDGFSRKPILEGIIKYRPKQTFINITQEEDNKELFDKLVYLKKGNITKIVRNKQNE
jgi:ABC-type multidrug transport system fused ATPase/permease subunit